MFLVHGVVVHADQKYLPKVNCVSLKCRRAELLKLMQNVDAHVTAVGVIKYVFRGGAGRRSTVQVVGFCGRVEQFACATVAWLVSVDDKCRCHRRCPEGEGRWRFATEGNQLDLEWWVGAEVFGKPPIVSRVAPVVSDA